MMQYGRSVIRFAEWEALTPAQRSAATERLVARAHAARSRAIGEALRGVASGLRWRLWRAVLS